MNPKASLNSSILNNYQNDAFQNIELQLNADVATRDTWIPFQRCNDWFPWSFCGAKPGLIFPWFLDVWKKINNNYDDYLRWQWWWMLQGKGTCNICFDTIYIMDLIELTWTIMMVITVMMIWWLWENEKSMNFCERQKTCRLSGEISRKSVRPIWTNNN